MSQVSYQVSLYNPNGERRALFVGRGRYGPTSKKQGTLVNFNFWKRLRSPGTFLLTIEGDDDRIDEFVDDAIIIIERRDVVANTPFVKVFEGFHRSSQFTRNQDGLDRFVSRGRGFNDLLASEPIFYDVGSTQALKSAASETAAKEYVNENIGPGAGVDALGNSRVRQGVTIQPDSATGATWNGDRAYSNLLDVLIELANFAPGDFELAGTAPGSFEFRWGAGQLGLDKTRGNTDGNAPVVFSPQRRNVESINIFDSRLDEGNVAYVLGQGAGNQRATRTRADATLLSASPWARRAVVRDASDEALASGLNARGDDTLSLLRPRLRTTFEILQSPSTRFMRDWDIGYLVTVEYRSFGIDQKIIGARVSFTENGVETIRVETDDPT